MFASRVRYLGNLAMRMYRSTVAVWKSPVNTLLRMSRRWYQVMSRRPASVKKK